MKYYFFSYVLNIPGKGFEFGNGTSQQQDDEFFDIYLIQNKIEEYSTDECSACILHHNEISESDYKGLQSSKHDKLDFSCRVSEMSEYVPQPYNG